MRTNVKQMTALLGLIGAVLGFESTSARAQTTNAPATAIRLAPAARVLRAVATAVEAGAGETATGNAAAATAAKSTNTTDATTATTSTDSTESSLAKAVRTMKLERTPEALFDAVRTQKAGGKLSEAEKFRLAVVLGDWPAVATTLKAQPGKDGMTIFSRVLEAMATNSISADQLFKQSRSSSSSSANIVSSSGGATAKPVDKRTVLLSDDFYALLEAAPANLDHGHLPHLTSLIKVAVGSSGRQDFLKRLSAGIKGIGGTTPSGRKIAAELLSSVGWMNDAGPYLPLKREEWSDADTLTLVLTMEYFTQNGVEKKDERELKRSAEVCAFMMQTSRFGGDESGVFRQATDRFVKLLPALEPDDAEQLIRENFMTQPVLMVDLILALGEVGQAAAKGSDMRARQQSLATQSILLRVLQGKKSALPEAVNVLVMNWLTEAEQTYRHGGSQSADNGYESDGYVVYRSFASTARAQSKTLEASVIMEHSPSPTLVRRLNPGLAQRVNLTLLKVNLLDPKEPVTLDVLKGYLKQHPGQEKDLCEDYLAAWVRKRTVVPEDPNVTRLRLMGYSVPKPAAVGIPLTRLRQNKNVQDLKELVTALRQLSPEPIEPKNVVQSFMSIHSGAEVYRLADIEGIFGPPEKMNRGELMNLVSGMRSKLREQWRDPKGQQDAGTNRTEEETKDEVSRGYRTAIELVRRGLKPDNSEWKEFIVRGQLFFDTSEYEFSRQVKLTDYVNLRDEAFASYRKASELYASQVPSLARGQWTIEPYQMWFFVMLGASDLSQLTRAAARSDPGLRLIGEAMRALPGDAAEAHQQKFGEMLGSILPQVPANMKQRFLNSGLQIIGQEHPSGKVARDALASYQELLDEVQLHLEVDGSTKVGFGQPFGVFISLEHSKQLARESGGFTKYLQNLASQSRNYYFSSGSQKPVNYRDEFSKNIHGSLDETFEVSSITFQDANVKTIDMAREGFQQTPLAYVVLRAKDAAVDRIPSIQLDMDFSDQAGQVVLPVRTQVQPIEAKEPSPARRPCEELGMTFTMDEREWRDGKLVVEVAAHGRGIIPAHQQMFDYQRPGFDVEVTDNGLSITQFESDGKRKLAQADRHWQFTYRRTKDLRGDVNFKFPTVLADVKPSTLEYKHYDDADLVTIDAAKVAAGVPLRNRTSNALRLTAIVGGVLVVLAAVVFFARRGRQATAPISGGLEMPAQITPFSVVAFLRRIQRETNGRLDEAAKQSLQTQIREIETAYFRGGVSANGAATGVVGSAGGSGTADLEAVARKWQRTAAPN